MKTTLSPQIFPKGLAKILLGIPMDPILKFLQRADRQLSEKVHFCPLWCIVSELWLFVLRYVRTPENRLYLPPPPPKMISGWKHTPEPSSPICFVTQKFFLTSCYVMQIFSYNYIQENSEGFFLIRGRGYRPNVEISLFRNTFDFSKLYFRNHKREG